MTRELMLEPPATATPSPGDLLAGKYRILRELGRGGMGTVFESVNVLTERRFAIKWLRFSREDTLAQRRFKREAKLAGRVRHPHVVDVYDLHVGESGCFIVMELLEGESLGQHLRRVKRVTFSQAQSILVPCAAGVSSAHMAGVVHRDLKPDNIFLARADGLTEVCPKVLDFGISRMAEITDATMPTTDTHTGGVIGTPAYMAPEQLLAQPCDARTDVYALGVTLYEMLAGERPYVGATYAALVAKTGEGDAVPIEQRVPELAPSAGALIRQAMHRDPAQRFATAAEFRDALLRAQNSQSAAAFKSAVSAAKVPAVPRTRRGAWWTQMPAWLRSRPAAVVVVCVSSAVGAALGLQSRAPQRAENIVKPSAPRAAPPLLTITTVSAASDDSTPTGNLPDPEPAPNVVGGAAQQALQLRPSPASDAAKRRPSAPKNVPRTDASIPKASAKATSTQPIADGSSRQPMGETRGEPVPSGSVAAGKTPREPSSVGASVEARSEQVAPTEGAVLRRSPSGLGADEPKPIIRIDEL